MKFSYIKNKPLFTLIMVAITGFTYAQETGVSPYSRFGLGSLNTFHSPAYRGMGGASIALSDFNQINMLNSASYAFLKEYRPVFEADFHAQFLNLEANVDGEKITGSQRNTNVSRFSIALPLNKKLGLGLGLLPYTTTGYNITSNDSVPTLGTVNYLYKGNGGINKTYLGLGYKIIAKDSVELALGFDASYYFGGITQEKRTEFPDDDDAQYALVQNNTRVGGFSFGVGVQYKQKLSNKAKLLFGASVNTGAELNGNRSILNAAYDKDLLVERNLDTLSYNENIKGDISIPLEFRVGAAIEFDEKLTFSAQYKAQNWQDYKEEFEVNQAFDSLQAANEFAFGLRYRPLDVFSQQGLFNRIEYRLGARFGETAVQYNGTPVQEFGMSFGVGIPIAKSTSERLNYKSVSMIQLGVEYGSRGTTNNGLIKEDFTRIYFGVSIMPNYRDRWFRKRKID